MLSFTLFLMQHFSMLDFQSCVVVQSTPFSSLTAKRLMWPAINQCNTPKRLFTISSN